ncbi:MAG: saccharopine dehydrogenase C-terminal domain-containing protein [Candidatus Odinarchaeota archaeon]
MKTVLVLGAGLVAGPHVKYLLDHGFRVIVASRTLGKAENLIGDHPNGEAKEYDITKDKDKSKLDELVKEADLSVSLLPYTYHVYVAKACIKNKKHMVTTSYVSPEMKELDRAAKEAGIIILNEIGVDPGIDHMSAQKIIDSIHKKGGKVEKFHSYCGGLPAPEASDNPFGYKISWSPRGVLLAGRNDGKFLKDGKVVEIPGVDLFDHHYEYPVDGLGVLDAYPNRDSVPYIDIYGIPEAKTMFRGTLRNKGWCETLKKFADTGILAIEEQDIPKGTTYGEYLRKLMDLPEGDIREVTAKKLGLPVDSEILDRFEWMGLFSDEEVPYERSAPIDVLGYQFQKRLQYREGERDMLVMVHEFIADYGEYKEKITSTMLDFGLQDSNGSSSMSRTVGLPASIGVRMILEGTITDTGVHIPVKKSIYEPVLKELEEMNIGFKEKIVKL